MKVRTGIIGGSGYTGGELLRLLLRHPAAQLVFVHSRAHAGKPVAGVHRDLAGETELTFTAETQWDVDVVFLCLAHGESKAFLKQHTLPPSVKIIDLSHDFRLVEHEVDRNWVYGLPELNRQTIKSAQAVANPGCFATAIQLALLPVARAGRLNKVYVTGITGATGAGAKLQDTLHFSWRAANVSAYKTLAHQHMGEVMRSLRQLQLSGHVEVNFVPWRGDFTRGIFISAVIESSGFSDKEIRMMYNDYYAGHPFTVIADEMIDLKMVVNTNKCIVYPEVIEGKLVVHAAIDNLLKGAAGQAVQNMNLMFGLEETLGLKLKASAF